ncbi:MAG: hypothetical protein RH862_05710 [Leptospiraceae bacterium]
MQKISGISGNPANKSYLLCISLAVFYILACERAPDLEKTHSFSKLGIEFKYPGNWSIMEDEITGAGRYILIRTTGDGITMIQYFRRPQFDTLQDFAGFMTELYSQEFQEGAVQDIDYQKIDGTLGPDNVSGLRETHSLNAAGQTLVVVREFFRMSAGSRWIYITHHIPREDYQQVRPGFDLIRSSMKVDENNLF